MNSHAETPVTGNEWWRTAVIYQIYPRSFADASGDGVGDLRGITGRLDQLEALGVDAIWLSPFYTSPQRDAGYDVADFTDVDPLFGTLADFDEMVTEAHARGLRVIVDIVPNHTSDQHEWFQQAIAAAPGSPERDKYIFRPGRGPSGAEPPNNWVSVFGGPAWTRLVDTDGTPGEWYLHLFDTSQPDLNWANDGVLAGFDDVLRFWLDRGVDGFRVDVAHGLIKAEGLPDFVVDESAGSMGSEAQTPPFWAQEGVHDVWRRWRRVLESYEGERILAAEAWVYPLSKMAKWVRSDEMHQAFNFAYLETPWEAAAMREIIDLSISEFAAVGAPSTWVLSNHDVVRHATRLSLSADNPQGHGLGPRSIGLPNPVQGLRRARAATLLMLALPGSSYIYQGEELGLPEAIDVPDEAREDPTFFRTNGERYGRDGCRVPLPWNADAPAYGFSTTGAAWLPQPEAWRDLARDAQVGVPDSTLEMYTTALALRREFGTAMATLEWLDDAPDGCIGFRVGEVTVLANIDGEPVSLPAGEVLGTSSPITDTLPADTTVWVRT
ncbi:glycoside hydrolase family 13 protein [Demequina aurantiaca]|uniref:glycoside hydrolase family 13 protein n=1 Tax=Demequina aurantiaca TaxID=676200 RepID=UPI000784FC51|nr:glycoside hydrolase family 13 protein [Demequina aurantiaca]